MSLPKAFASAEAYFEAAVEFLQSYAWVFSEANTSCIKALDCMPQQFSDYFIGLSNEQLNAFPFVHEVLEDCPEQLLHFRQQIAQLTPQQAAPIEPSGASQAARKCCKQNRKIGLKKLHEIEQLAERIHKDCTEIQTQLLIDLGSGLGYLSEALFGLKNNFLILGLEADEQRVDTARQRCQNLLPQAAHNLISYKKEFIQADANSRARIESYANELAQDHELATGLIGLHACADLSISAMTLFLTMPRVRSLHIMPCCYHKLALRETSSSLSSNSPFVNFPLSSGLCSVLSAPSAAQVSCFQRPFMRLACQQTRSRWSVDSLSHTQHGRQMYLRALANELCDVDELVKLRQASSALAELSDSFNDMQQRYELYSRHTGKPLDWRPGHEARFNQVSKRYADGRGSCLAEALCCLQTSLQKLCENLLLYDRLCYLQEAAAAQHLQLEVRYEKLFDEQVSPRCHVLIAKKL